MNGNWEAHQCGILRGFRVRVRRCRRGDAARAARRRGTSARVIARAPQDARNLAYGRVPTRSALHRRLSRPPWVRTVAPAPDAARPLTVVEAGDGRGRG